jgi:hypothetical protein
MKLNFLETFKDQSNIDLLKITLRPNEYEQEAVEAATKILQEREVPEDEITAVKNYYDEMDSKQQSWEGKINSFKKRTSDLVEPIVNPSSEINPSRWVNLFLIATVVLYLWFLYRLVRHFIFLMQCQTCHIDVSDFIEFSGIVYIPVTFYLIWKKKKWGWILLFADNLFEVIMMVLTYIGELYLYFKYGDLHIDRASTFIISMLIRIVFLFFLWKKEIASYFGVSRNLKKRTLIFSTIIILIYIIIVNIMTA